MDPPPPSYDDAVSSHDALVARLVAVTGTEDTAMLRSVLEANDWDFDRSLHMMLEAYQASEQYDDVRVIVVFEDQRFEFELPPSATLTELKNKLEEASNIVPQQQMLIDTATQMEPPERVPLGDLRQSSRSNLVMHLLTPNSSA
eukprot:m.302171 g.302171  ORF g.302171 m.302171 type:complete len:144 (+) comp15044_c0_seq1:103-534(+)